MLPLLDLPSGNYLIASHTHRNKVFYAGRLGSKPSKPTQGVIPPLHAPGVHNLDDDATMPKHVSYFADGSNDWAFLEELDEDLPIAFVAPGSPRNSTTSRDSDSDSALSPVAEVASTPGTPALVADSALHSSESSDECDAAPASVRFARSRGAKGPRGRKVFAVSGEQPEWHLERLASGRYALTMRGAPTGIRDGLLLAYDAHASAPAEAVEEWELRPHVVPGPKGRERERELVYTIEWATGGAGWVRQGSEGSIAVAPMSGQICEEELWKILPLTSA
ncbi:hypothetical protein PsYK624_157890 [Phanerochaete sordida]|uniref:Uncharacterized protein n=1 Tax=Phanerochaete sordida TaxID=48140 RepID=A0A9P3LLB4_9APHY|nr:hypothetical protein PsYK624_157890 [Phanerochaete sordida]